MRVYHFGIIHAFAQCDDCEWDATIDIKSKNRMSKLRSQIRRHIEKTNHTVQLETGNATEYKP